MSKLDTVLKIEMDNLSTYHRMEPSIPQPSDEENNPLTSIAISLKRIADCLDGVTAERRNELEKSRMVAALTRKKKFSPAEIHEIISEYFADACSS